MRFICEGCQKEFDDDLKTVGIGQGHNNEIKNETYSFCSDKCQDAFYSEVTDYADRLLNNDREPEMPRLKIGTKVVIETIRKEQIHATYMGWQRMWVFYSTDESDVVYMHSSNVYTMTPVKEDNDVSS